MPALTTMRRDAFWRTSSSPRFGSRRERIPVRRTFLSPSEQEFEYSTQSRALARKVGSKSRWKRIRFHRTSFQFACRTDEIRGGGPEARSINEAAACVFGNVPYFAHGKLRVVLWCSLGVSSRVRSLLEAEVLLGTRIGRFRQQA